MALIPGLAHVKPHIKPERQLTITLPSHLATSCTIVRDYLALVKRYDGAKVIYSVKYVGLFDGATPLSLPLTHLPFKVHSKITKHEHLEEDEEAILLDEYAAYVQGVAQAFIERLVDFGGKVPTAIPQYPFRSAFSFMTNSSFVSLEPEIFRNIDGCGIETSRVFGTDVSAALGLKGFILGNVGGLTLLNPAAIRTYFVGVASNLHKSVLWLDSPVPSHYTTNAQHVSAHDGVHLKWAEIAQAFADSLDRVVGYHAGPHALRNFRGEAHAHFHVWDQNRLISIAGKTYPEPLIGEMAYFLETVAKRQDLDSGRAIEMDRAIDMQILKFPHGKEPAWYLQVRELMCALAFSTPQGFERHPISYRKLIGQWEMALSFVHAISQRAGGEWHDALDITNESVPIPRALGIAEYAATKLVDTPVHVVSATRSITSRPPKGAYMNFIETGERVYPYALASTSALRSNKFDVYKGATLSSLDFNAGEGGHHTIANVLEYSNRQYINEASREFKGERSVQKEVDVCLTARILERSEERSRVLYLGDRGTDLFGLLKLKADILEHNIQWVYWDPNHPYTYAGRVYRVDEVYDYPEYLSPVVAQDLSRLGPRPNVTYVGLESSRSGGWQGMFQQYDRSGPPFDYIFSDVDLTHIYEQSVDDITENSLVEQSVRFLREMILLIQRRSTDQCRGYFKMNWWNTEAYADLFADLNAYLEGVISYAGGAVSNEVYVTFDKNIAAFGGQVEQIGAMIDWRSRLQEGYVRGLVLGLEVSSHSFVVPLSDAVTNSAVIATAVSEFSTRVRIYDAGAANPALYLWARRTAYDRTLQARWRHHGRPSLTHIFPISSSGHTTTYTVPLYIHPDSPGSVFRRAVVAALKADFIDQNYDYTSVLDIGGGSYVGAIEYVPPGVLITCTDPAVPAAHLDRGITYRQRPFSLTGSERQDPYPVPPKIAYVIFSIGQIMNTSGMRPRNTLHALLRECAALGCVYVYVLLNYVPRDEQVFEQEQENGVGTGRYREVHGRYSYEPYRANWEIRQTQRRFIPITIQDILTGGVRAGFHIDRSFERLYPSYLRSWRLACYTVSGMDTDF